VPLTVRPRRRVNAAAAARVLPSRLEVFRRELGPEFRAPVKSRVRALFISGTLDGRTPVANAEEVLKGFPRGEHLVVEGASHGYDLFYFTPQVKEAMIEFLKGKRLSVQRVTLSSFPFNPVNLPKKN
jgi:pimeloyl-ACP methyl ester carboxylesterase